MSHQRQRRWVTNQRMQIGYHCRRTIRFTEKAAVGRQIGQLQPNMTRCDEYLYDRPAVAHDMGQLQTVHASGHVDVGEQHGNFGAGFQYRDGLVRIAGLQRLEACLVDEFHRKHPQARVVLDN